LIVASATAPHADVTATFSSAPARARATTPIARVSRLAKAIARLAVVVRRVVARVVGRIIVVVVIVIVVVIVVLVVLVVAVVPAAALTGRGDVEI
jgi:hypothetical protein